MQKLLTDSAKIIHQQRVLTFEIFCAATGRKETGEQKKQRRSNKKNDIRMVREQFLLVCYAEH